MGYRVQVSREDFSVGKEYEQLATGSEAGAVVTFVGKVRDMNLGDDIVSLSLEHYPGMTEKVLGDICKQAAERWSLCDVRVIHRIGEIQAGEQIVFVGVTSAHRSDSFSACEFIMDFLKTNAPFWKKEITTESTRWVESKQSDHQATDRWLSR
ncbi:molybdopterin synthase catalytic subunit MoaE [Vibrio albus]|uniref:Molybdopterin synthase catalytic subunit n=1 Tax=Vibrio albus TaxID=2200953 RepID=A0A2U3BBZ8_9VIBR|nr:molybdopterin synthase catalytic subunit MoaE [Vibrio albus]PWI34254.1 molybdopterin synthase catalytic subunit MoaE [Vibrio albus]